MSNEIKKVTRTMKVTMTEEEFKKFDLGITHSDGGIRTEDGRLSTLPDIAPLNEIEKTDTEYERTAVQEYTYDHSERTSQTGVMDVVLAFTDLAAQIAQFLAENPEIVKGAVRLGSKIKSKVSSGYSKIAARLKIPTKQNRRNDSENVEVLDEKEYEIEVFRPNNERIIVTSDQAEHLVSAMREKAKELAAMIYLLSIITIKDEKTDADYILEEAYIKQLLSEEETNTIKMLVNNRELLDKGTELCFDDWLNGYIRNGDQRIPIPRRLETTELAGKRKSYADPMQNNTEETG